MGKRITINNLLLFEPGRKTLSMNGKETSISGPSSLCFELLLERKGEICLYEELYEFVWRRFNMEVAPATLHQHIALLRKGLKEVGADHKIVRTVTKRGFIVPFGTKVLTENSNDTLTENNNEKNTNVNNIPVKNKSFHFFRKKFFLICFTCLGITGIYFLSNNLFGADNYTPYDINEGCDCSFYVAKGMLPAIAQVKKTILKLDIKSFKKKYIYLTMNKNSDRASFFICKYPIASEKVSECESFYFVGVEQ